MKDTKLLQYIIGALEKSSLMWKGDRELFELLFAPVSYGNEPENIRKRTIKPIHDICKVHKAYEPKRLNKMAHNIRCGCNEKKDREAIVAYLTQSLPLDISHIAKLVEKIPCKEPYEENYRSQFSHWKNKRTDTNIQEHKIKKALQNNFDFPDTLWGSSETKIKEVLQVSIERFVKKRTQTEIDLFSKIRKEFHMESRISAEELDDLQKIRGMNQQEIMSYIFEYHPLRKNKSQEFILKLISILDAKGYFQLLLQDALTELTEFYEHNKEIKKITAHAYGSKEVNRPLDAFDILSTIDSDDDEEVADMMTEAISNLRRHYLNDESISQTQKEEAVQKILSYYEEVFAKTGEAHYYPGINLAYMTAIAKICFPSTISPKYTLHEIFKRVHKSIGREKESDNFTERYYANMAWIEFDLLNNKSDSLHKLEIFLEEFGDKLSLVALERTKRQMQFFIDTTLKLSDKDSSMEKMQQAIQIIEDFGKTKI